MLVIVMNKETKLLKRGIVTGRSISGSNFLKKSFGNPSPSDCKLPSGILLKPSQGRATWKNKQKGFGKCAFAFHESN